jgi:hypothetical protein
VCCGEWSVHPGGCCCGDPRKCGGQPAGNVEQAGNAEGGCCIGESRKCGRGEGCEPSTRLGHPAGNVEDQHAGNAEGGGGGEQAEGDEGGEGICRGCLHCCLHRRRDAGVAAPLRRARLALLLDRRRRLRSRLLCALPSGSCIAHAFDASQLLQHLLHLLVTQPDAQLQRRLANPTLRLHVRALLHQRGHRLHVSIDCCPVQRPPSVTRLGLLVRAQLHQRSYRLHVPVDRRPMQRRRSTRLGFQVRTHAHQRSHHRHPPAGYCPMQRPPLSISRCLHHTTPARRSSPLFKPTKSPMVSSACGTCSERRRLVAIAQRLGAAPDFEQHCRVSPPVHPHLSEWVSE